MYNNSNYQWGHCIFLELIMPPRLIIAVDSRLRVETHSYTKEA